MSLVKVNYKTRNKTKQKKQNIKIKYNFMWGTIIKFRKALVADLKKHSLMTPS